MSYREWAAAASAAVGAAPGGLLAALAFATAAAASTAPLPAAPVAAPVALPRAAASAAPAAAAVVDACPKALDVRQSVVADIPGWTATSPQESYPFARIAFYAGPPADDKRVVPTFENRTATGLHDGWMLPRQPAGYWVRCQYGNTAATVASRLDDADNFCVADYDPRFSSLVVKHWACMPGRPGMARPHAAALARPATSRPRLPAVGAHGQ